jgi:hypothetical protein
LATCCFADWQSAARKIKSAGNHPRISIKQVPYYATDAVSGWPVEKSPQEKVRFTPLNLANQARDARLGIC